MLNVFVRDLFEYIWVNEQTYPKTISHLHKYLL